MSNRIPDGAPAAESLDCHPSPSLATAVVENASRNGPGAASRYGHAVDSGVRFIVSIPKSLLLGVFRLYQKFISPMTPPTCRFYPTCSQYAITSLQDHGLLRGFWLAVRRLCRCHPWNAGGVDHVPPRRGTSPQAARSSLQVVNERDN